MRISDAIIYGKKELKAKNIPEINAEHLLAHMLNQKREWLFTHSEQEIDAQKFKKILNRHTAGEPLAYIVGHQTFYNREFEVNPSVLIPRQETEQLVEEVLSELKSKEKVIDVGTGSGAIAITLKLQKPEIEVFACDISAPALKVARQNAKQLNAEIKFIKSDLLENISEDIDIIVANLPYVPAKNNLPNSVVKFEPHTALYAGLDGLDLYRRLLDQVSNLPKKPRKIFFEIGYDQADFFRNLPNAKIKIQKDLNQFDRIAIIQLD